MHGPGCVYDAKPTKYHMLLKWNYVYPTFSVGAMSQVRVQVPQLWVEVLSLSLVTSRVSSEYTVMSSRLVSVAVIMSTSFSNSVSTKFCISTIVYLLKCV